MDHNSTSASEAKEAICFEEPKPAYYAVIPASVRYCKALEAGAKLLYGDIAALCHNEQAHCWATNAYLARLHDVDERTIKRWLESLAANQFISIQVTKDSKGTHRYIQLQDPKISVGGGQKCPPGGTKMSHRQDNFVQKSLYDSPLPNITISNTKKRPLTPRSGGSPAARKSGLRANGESPRQRSLQENLVWAQHMIQQCKPQADKLGIDMRLMGEKFYVSQNGSPHSESYEIKSLSGSNRDRAIQTMLRLGLNLIGV